MRRSLALLLLLPCLGCGGVKYAPVSGKVTMDGQPLSNAHVNFQPIAEGTMNPGPGSHGKTDENGNYTLEVVGGGQGAVVGKHRVTVSLLIGTYDPNSDAKKPLPEKVPSKYN